MSIQTIQQNPQDISNFYLSNIYKATIADTNQSNISSLPSSPPSFSPPKSAVWVNALWFLSLVISLTCALLATLLQQWARRYLKVTHSRYSPHKRARIRAFFAEGVEKLLLPRTVEILPALLHTSLFLFFAGLVVFLRNIDLTIFKLVLSWVGICTALYGCFTFIPIFRHDSPYYTSLSSSVWLVVIGIRYVASQVHYWFQWSVKYHRPVFWRYEGRSFKWLMQGMQRTAEETALNPRPEIDTRAFMWTFDCLDEDHELERFFAGLPGFRSSEVVRDPLPDLTEEEKHKLSETLTGLLDRTFSSDLLPKSDQYRRAIICATAIPPTEIPDVYWWIFRRIQNGDRGRLCTAEFGRMLKARADGENQRTAPVVQATLTSIVARATRRNDSWFVFASGELGVPGSVLRDYAAHGDSLLLAILIHVARQQFSQFQNPDWPSTVFMNVLEAASQFDVQDTLPELQHKFCALWNQVVLTARNGNNMWMAFKVLRPLREVYITLHQGTEANPKRFLTYNQELEPTSYLLCSVPSHHLGSTPHTHDNSAPTPSAHAVLHDNVARVPDSLVNPDVHSSPISTARVDESLMDVPRPDDNLYIPGSFHPARQTPLRVPAVSQDPVTARVIPRATCIPTTPVPSTTGPSASTPSMASTSLLGVIPIHRVAVHHTSSDILDVPPPITVLNNMLPTGI